MSSCFCVTPWILLIQFSPQRKWNLLQRLARSQDFFVLCKDARCCSSLWNFMVNCVVSSDCGEGGECLEGGLCLCATEFMSVRRSLFNVIISNFYSSWSRERTVKTIGRRTSFGMLAMKHLELSLFFLNWSVSALLATNCTSPSGCQNSVLLKNTETVPLWRHAKNGGWRKNTLVTYLLIGISVGCLSTQPWLIHFV